MRLGELDIIPVSDGWFIAPDGYFGADADLSAHADLLDDDGRLVLPLGCFVVRTGDRTVLVDAGLGPMESEIFQGGALLTALADAGVSPDEIDLVVLSHLHIDHCGWVVDKDLAPVFPKATLRVGAADWRDFVDDEQAMMRGYIRAGLRALADAGRVETFDGDTTLAPGIDALSAPGHTHGHACIVLSSGDERALLLGDAITCPVQLDETAWGAMSDVDPTLAARTRERMWQELEADGTVGAGAHFPGLQFGRVLSGQGRRWWS